MSWISIDSQADLNHLDAAACWEDSEVLEYHSGNFVLPHIPTDVSRSGHSHPNIHVLLSSADAQSPYLEIAFVHCDHLGVNVWQHFYPAGRVESLKRIELESPDGVLRVRCARLIYRWLEDVDISRPFYGREA